MTLPPTLTTSDRLAVEQFLWTSARYLGLPPPESEVGTAPPMAAISRLRGTAAVNVTAGVWVPPKASRVGQIVNL